MKLSNLTPEQVPEFVEILCGGDLSVFDLSGVKVQEEMEDPHVFRGYEFLEPLEYDASVGEWLKDLPELFDDLMFGGPVVFHARGMTFDQIRFIDRIYSFLLTTFQVKGPQNKLGSLEFVVDKEPFLSITGAQSELNRASYEMAALFAPYDDYHYIYRAIDALSLMQSYFPLGGCTYNILVEEGEKSGIIVVRNQRIYDLGMGGLLGMKRIEDAALLVLDEASGLVLSEDQTELLTCLVEERDGIFTDLKKAVETFEEMEMCSYSWHIETITRED